ncbi:hypothetical protein AAHC03_0519 [Spirometra sp. Aus1]
MENVFSLRVSHEFLLTIVQSTINRILLSVLLLLAKSPQNSEESTSLSNIGRNTVLPDISDDSFGTQYEHKSRRFVVPHNHHSAAKTVQSTFEEGNSVVLLSPQGRTNRFTRRNNYRTGSGGSYHAVDFSEPAPTNQTLRPVRVFHQPHGPAPYIIELYVVVDEKFVKSYRSDIAGILARVNTLFKHVNALFAPFNVRVVLVRLEIWKTDRVRMDVEDHHLLKTLANFKRTRTDVRHDCLHAIVADEGTQISTTRGKATKEKMCTFSSCVGFTRDAPFMDPKETARTIAHELGHSLGLRHDTEECECQGCIMATGVEVGTTTMEWSLCSLRDLPVLLEHGMGSCLHDTPLDGHTSLVHASTMGSQPASVVRVFNGDPLRPGKVPEPRSRTPPLVTESLCGNGKLDPGEECDCGTSETCPNATRSCCDVYRCRLINGAECATGPCCEVTSTSGGYQCRLRSAGSTCRPETGSCDLPEFCDGASEWCPADVYKIDGEVCYTEHGYKSYCVRGGCRSSQDWCQTLWGDTATHAGYGCTDYNMQLLKDRKADDVANCGKSRPIAEERWNDAQSWPSKVCKNWEDAQCGRLWCLHSNEKAMLLGWIQSQQRVDPRSGRSCLALVYDPVDIVSYSSVSPSVSDAAWGYTAAKSQDAGMVPDGTPCRHGMCYNGSCVALSSIPVPITCSCNSNGVCNNLGNCHCNPGFAPPHCLDGGDGGSIDSGPPPPSKHRMAIIAAILVILLIVLPIFCIVMFCLLCRCKKGKLVLPKSGPLPSPVSYATKRTTDINTCCASLSKCCRKCVPRLNNDPPIICAFGPLNKDIGEIHENGLSPKSPSGNGYVKSNGVAAPARSRHHSNNRAHPTGYRDEYSAVGKSKPGYLLDIEAAWAAAEVQAANIQSSAQSQPVAGDLKPPAPHIEISSPRLQTTTFRGETQTLAAASKNQQRAAAQAATTLNAEKGSSRKRVGKMRAPTQPITSFGELGPLSPPVPPSKGSAKPSSKVSRSKSMNHQPPTPLTVEISAPTLQNTTYNHALLELPEAYSTLRRPKKQQHSTTKPKEFKKFGR